MQVITIGDAKFVAVKTSESLFIIGMSDGLLNSVWNSISDYGSFRHYDMNIMVNHGIDVHWTTAAYSYDRWAMAYGADHGFKEYLSCRIDEGHYRDGNFAYLNSTTRFGQQFHWHREYALPRGSDHDYTKHPRYVKKKQVLDTLAPLLSHFPYGYRDLPGVRIVLTNDIKELDSEGIINHVVNTNISLLNIGIIRISWVDSEKGLEGKFKYKFKTHRECFDEYLKTYRKIIKPIKDLQAGITTNLPFLYISEDPNETSIPEDMLHIFSLSISGTIQEIDKAVSDNTLKVRKMFTDLLSNKVIEYKTIYVKGWEIVAGYQSLYSHSCMTGTVEGYDNYLVEAYAHSPSCTLALMIRSDEEDSVRKHLSDIATKCERGIHPEVDRDWYHSGIIARCMVWEFENVAGKWYDRLYWDADLRGGKANTICNLFMSLLKADGIKQYRCNDSGSRTIDAELVLTPSSGDWDEDREIGLPYMDTFDCGYLTCNGYVRCFSSCGYAEIRGVPRKKLFELKVSTGIYTIITTWCPVCGESTENLSTITVYNGSRTIERDMCDVCLENNYVELDRSEYGRYVWACRLNTFYCESTDSNFYVGDAVPDHIEIDGEWHHVDSYEAVKHLKELEKEKEDEEVETVSCIYDLSDLRRRQRSPITDCTLDVARNVYVLKDIWKPYLDRRVQELEVHLRASTSVTIPQEQETV